MMGTSLLYTGDIAQGAGALDRAIALYDPAEHRPLATRFGQDVRMAILSYRSLALWSLGYPEAALADADQCAQRCARDRSSRHFDVCADPAHALTHILCGNYAAANAQADELVALARRKGRLLLEGDRNDVEQGCCIGRDGQSLRTQFKSCTAGIAAVRSTGATLWMPFWLSCLARAYAELGQFDEAWRCIGEAMTVDGNNEGKVVRGRGQSHGRGNRA